MKIVINRCIGGFSLSEKAVMRYAEIKGLKLIPHHGVHRQHYYIDQGPNKEYFSDLYIQRNDPVLIQVVEELVKDADGFAAELKVVEIPDDIEWHITDYDGIEHIAENHRTWR